MFPDMFHIRPSMDERWINEMYAYIGGRIILKCILKKQDRSVWLDLSG